MKNQKLYHYLVKPELELALARKALRASEYFLSNGAERFLWLTFSPHWERIVAGLDQNNDPSFFGLSFQALAETETIIRIQINPSIALLNWDNWLDYFNLSAKEKSAINKHFRSLGTNPDLWRFFFDPIPSALWWGIECWDGSKWEPYPGWDPSESVVYLADHNEVVHNLTAKTTLLESERDKAKAEALGVKALADSKDGRIALLESSNGKLQQEAEVAKKQLQHFLDSHTESALEQKIKAIEEEKKSESLGKELLGEDLEKANKAILEKDRAIDSRDSYVTYLQARLRARGIPFNPHYGHQNRLKDVA